MGRCAGVRPPAAEHFVELPPPSTTTIRAWAAAVSSIFSFGERVQLVCDREFRWHTFFRRDLQHELHELFRDLPVGTDRDTNTILGGRTNSSSNSLLITY